MFSVYRKELKLYFRTKSTYIVLAILLAAIGICTAILAPMGGLQFIPIYLAPITLATAPLLQLFAKKRQKRTHFEDCCFSMGISPLSITVGRFLAILTVFLIPVLELALLPPLFSMMGSIAYGSVYTSVLGYVLLTALLLAMVQALLDVAPETKGGAVCAFLPSVAFYLFQLLITLLPLGEVPLSLVTAINPIGLFYAFTYGRFPIADLVSLLAGIALCLAVGTLLCAHRRADFALPTRRRTATAVASVLLVLALCLSMGVALIPERLLNPSVSNSQTFDIVAGTKAYLEKLDEDITIYYLVSGGKKSADTDMQYFLYDIAALSPHVEVKIVDTAKETELLARYGATQLSDQSFIVASRDRHMLLDANDLYHYYNADLQISLSPLQYSYYLSAYSYYMQTQTLGEYSETAVSYGASLYASQTTVAYFDGCVRLTNAMHYATSETVPVAKILGAANAMDSTLQTYLISAGYYFENIASPLQIGNDCDLLIIHTPKNDITKGEASALSSYLANGGKVFLITSCVYTDLPNLYSVTQEFGLDVLDTKNIVCEQDGDYLYSADRPYYFAAHIASHEITKAFTGLFTVVTAHAIQIDESLPDVTVTPLLYTGEETGCLMYSNDEIDKDNSGKFVCGAISQKGEGSILWLSSPESASVTGYSLSSGGNFTWIYAAMNWMTGNTYSNISVASTLMTSGNLAINTNGVTVLAVILAFAVPLALLIPSMVYLYKRKMR